MNGLVWVAVVGMLGGCMVPKKRYDALQAEYTASRADLESQVAERDSRIGAIDQELAAAFADLEAARAQIAALEEEKMRLEAQLDAAGAEKALLLRDKTALRASVADMEEALKELRAREAAAAARVAEYQSLVARFQSLIDAGQLRVKIVDGRMVVEMATDILFESGKADLSANGEAALREVGAVLASIPDRRFQVEGHTDNVPIKTDRFPSNWELAAARAIVVLNTLVKAGVAPTRLSAASEGEHRPVAPNDTPENKALNRRIENVVVPDLSTLPGTEELERLGG